MPGPFGRTLSGISEEPLANQRQDQEAFRGLDLDGTTKMAKKRTRYVGIWYIVFSIKKITGTTSHTLYVLHWPCSVSWQSVTT